MPDEGDWYDRILGGIEAVLSALSAGENVLVHCLEGKHRTGAFIIMLFSMFWMARCTSEEVDPKRSCSATAETKKSPPP